VISVLKETQTQTLTIINLIKNNVHNPITKRDKSKILLTLQNGNDHKIHKDLILYLRRTENSYQGKYLNKKKVKTKKIIFFFYLPLFAYYSKKNNFYKPLFCMYYFKIVLID
jgi:hypothetical protein